MKLSSRFHSLFIALIVPALVGAVVIVLPGIRASTKVNVAVIRLSKSMQASDGVVSSPDEIIPLLASTPGRRTADHHSGYLLGIAHLALSQEERAISLLHAATEQGSSFARYQLGQWFLGQKDLVSAKEYLDESVCNSYHCINDLAHALYQGGHREDAIAVLKNYVEQSPQNAAAHYQLTTMSWGNGDREETINAIENALIYDKATSSYRYRYHEARLAYLLKDYASAQSLLTKLMNEYPDEFSAPYLLGLTHRQLHKPDAAEMALKRALEISPSHTGAQISLARAYREGGKLPHAVSQYHTAITAMDSVSPMPRYLSELADVYEQNGDECRAQETRMIIDDNTILSNTDIDNRLNALNSLCEG